MNLRTATIALTLFAAAFSGWLVPMSEWSATAKSILTVLAIFAGAILVRLNRGMPTIDWSKVNLEDRDNLVEKIKTLAREYGATLIAVGFSLAFFLVLDRTNGDTPLSKLVTSSSPCLPKIISAIAGAVSSFVLIRIVYVVWRDIDIVDLQAGVISQAANAEITARNVAKAKEIEAAGVIDPRKNGQ